MGEIGIKIILIFGIWIFAVTTANQATKWVWSNQIDIIRTVNNLFDGFGSISENHLAPLKNWIAIRDDKKIYAFNGTELGLISGEVINQGNGIYFFPEIYDTPFDKFQGFEMEWKRKKFKLIDATDFAIQSGFKKNLFLNVRFQEIINAY